MEYVHIRNLEKYHPGYKDRNLLWCKAYFTMLNAEPEFELLCETDKWRFLSFVMLELQLKKPVPLDPPYLSRKGFDLKKRPISLTIHMLHNFVETVTQDSTLRVLDKEEDKDKEEEKGCVTESPGPPEDSLSESELKSLFDDARLLYPGIKRGLDTEWDNFRRKHTDWREIVPDLNPAIEILIAARERALKAKEFVPAWAHFQTWINQRRWEESLHVQL